MGQATEAYPECRSCGYPLIHLPELRCPECGATYDERYLRQTGQFQRRRRRKALAFVTFAGAVLCVSAWLTYGTQLTKWSKVTAARLLPDSMLVRRVVEGGESKYLKAELCHRLKAGTLSTEADADLAQHLYAYGNPRIELMSFDPSQRTLRFAVVSWDYLSIAGSFKTRSYSDALKVEVEPSSLLWGGPPFKSFHTWWETKGVRMWCVDEYYETTVPDGGRPFRISASRTRAQRVSLPLKGGPVIFALRQQRTVVANDLAALSAHPAKPLICGRCSRMVVPPEPLRSRVIFGTETPPSYASEEPPFGYRCALGACGSHGQ